jgi:hypothetical protein
MRLRPLPCFHVARAQRPKRSTPRPLAECLPHINVNDLKIPKSLNAVVTAPWISLRYPFISAARLSVRVVEFAHSGRIQSFRLKWIKTGFGLPRCCRNPERNQASSPASRSLATALPEGALARGLLRLRLIPRIDRPTIGCNKLSASEAPDPGRHHLGTPGDIISECPGDIIGIRTKAISHHQQATKCRYHPAPA